MWRHRTGADFIVEAVELELHRRLREAEAGAAVVTARRYPLVGVIPLTGPAGVEALHPRVAERGAPRSGVAGEGSLTAAGLP